MKSELTRISPIFYGIALVPKNVWREYGYALLTIAGSDGIVSDPEFEWLTLEVAKKVGVSDDIIADWEEFDYDGADLEEIFHSFNKSSLASFNKLLIYDAIRMCSADGEYAMEEKEQVMQAAKILNVSQDAVIAIEALVDLEEATNKLRLTIF
jgi:uncharacterized tellurite resistance protein B-like protein